MFIRDKIEAIADGLTGVIDRLEAFYYRRIYRASARVRREINNAFRNLGVK